MCPQIMRNVGGDFVYYRLIQSTVSKSLTTFVELSLSLKIYCSYNDVKLAGVIMIGYLYVMVPAIGGLSHCGE